MCICIKKNRIKLQKAKNGRTKEAAILFASFLIYLIKNTQKNYTKKIFMTQIITVV